MAQIIDGNAVSSEIRESIKNEVVRVQEKHNLVPGLSVVIVGADPASQVYVRMKNKRCAEVGIKSFPYELPEETTQEELLSLVDELNNNKEVNGILVQLPLPKHIDEKTVINAINPAKDVDGFHPVNTGKLMNGEDDCFLPCTPYGCQELISRNVQDLKGKHVVVVGRSNIVGKPIANMMLQKNDRANCTVTICHTGTKDMAYFTRQADILVVAAGHPNTITGDMVKDGVVVIDVGMNRTPHPKEEGKTKLTGDVNFDEVSERASAITPVPGGVGPMTIAMLLKNTLRAFKMHNGIE
ncbi:MAG: bifunctional methylenetetrahydrofolate dehydrogenase/methenyltetrahydrofolate cyclohydrolase FolD [bacterium]|nr:bifunctional methylenetetrahydrofolate dehydrogenase/methenyltetrahydrofolate cyclohydrolase FolD [bacterium]